MASIVAHRDRLALIDARTEPDLGELAIDQVAKPHQAACEDRARAALDSDRAGLEHLVGQQPAVEVIAQLVREPAESLGSFVLAQPAVLGDCTGDRLVEARAEDLKLVRGDRRCHLACELADRLANAAIVVNDLGDGEALAEQLVAVLGRDRANRIGSLGREPQGVGELIEEEGQAVLELGLLPIANGRLLRILVVDDDPGAVELVALHVMALGSTVLRAFGGQAAIEIARKELPDLIVLDLMMPDVNGFDVVEELAKDPATARIPFIVVTAHKVSAESRATLKGEVSMIMEKTELNHERFTSEVRRAMSGRNLEA